MTAPEPEKPTVDDLVARCREIAKKAPRHKPTAPETLERTATEPPPLSIVPPLPDNHQDDPDDPEPRFAGSDIDAMFDLDDYGGRLCDECYESIDQMRGGSRFCSDSCRAKSWRNGRRSSRNPHA